MEEIHYDMSKIKNKIKDLSVAHDKHLNRPTLDDNMDEERSIDNLTQEITNVLKNKQYINLRLLFFEILKS